MTKYLFTLLLLLITLSLSAKVYNIENVPNAQVKNKTHFVTNPDRILSESTVNELNQNILSIRNATSVEIAIVLIESIGQESIEEFAVKLFKHWGIGVRENDNGLLILFVGNQRKIRFEVGYGLEGTLTDAICKRIQMEKMVPHFRTENYDEGFKAAIIDIRHRLETPEAMVELAAPRPTFPISSTIVYTLIIYILCAFASFYMIQQSYRKNVKLTRESTSYVKYKAFVSTSTTAGYAAFFFPIPLLFFYLYLKRILRGLRNQPQFCERCAEPMTKLDEKKDNQFLDSAQDTEERIGSVDYDVWCCTTCQNYRIFRFDKQSTHYKPCPHCKTVAYSCISNSTIVSPTQLTEGKQEAIYFCEHCKKRDSRITRIPCLPVVIVTSGGNRNGGNFGGGFGGGRSGGGGASSGW